MHNSSYCLPIQTYIRKFISCAILLLASPTLSMQPFSQPTVDEIANSPIPSLQVLAMQQVVPQLHADLLDLIDHNKDITTTTSPILQYAQLQTLPIFAQALSREINKNNLLTHAIKKNCPVETLRFLLLPGVDIDKKNNDSNTALTLAIINKRNEIAKLLIESGADVHAKNKWDDTPLMYAASKGKHETAKLLLQSGANVHAKDNYGYTSLMYAAQNGHHETVKLLLQSGANVHAKDNYGYTSLMIATDNGHHEIVKLLGEYGANECIESTGCTIS